VKSKLAAELDQINVRQVVLSDEELVYGARSIAAPFRAHSVSTRSRSR
jgi:DNA-binding IclR family transcriptional regulator